MMIYIYILHLGEHGGNLLLRQEFTATYCTYPAIYITLALVKGFTSYTKSCMVILCSAVRQARAWRG